MSTEQKQELEFQPLPEGQEWHNPDNLTPEQVGVPEYRLITELERQKFDSDGAILRGWIQFWDLSQWDATGWAGSNKARTYRIPASHPFPEVAKDLAKMTSIQVNDGALETATLQPPSGPYTVIKDPHQPLSRRDHFAMAAMQGLLADGSNFPDELAKKAVGFADSLLAALDGKEAE